MFDMHYDLLTYVYINRNNLIEVKNYLKNIFENNITGGIFNLFYMFPKQMKDELEINKEEINVIDNLKLINRLIKDNNLIPENVKYIYGIEGLDYLKKIDDIDVIYKLGVRSVNPLWNNDNQFGGGVKGDKERGLTKIGEKLIRKLVDSKIAIDLSHSNEKTFYDIINLCNKLKEAGKKPKVFASHSNIRKLCNVPRNLTDDQIIKIKKLDGLIGIVGVKPFCIKNESLIYNRKYENAYIEHIGYLKQLLNGVDNISVATDDMTYYKTNKIYYKHFNVFKQDKMKGRLEKLLKKNKFKEYEIEKILYKNAERFINKIDK